MEQKDRAKPGIDLKKYEDPDGLTLQRMHFGLWLSLNRRKIIKAIIIILIVASAAMFIYSTYNYIFYFLYGRQADQELAASLAASQVESQNYREVNTPKEMETGAVSVFSVQGKYDFLIHLKNLNDKHFSNFNYCLQTTAGQNIVCGASFILPGEEKYLLLVGKELDSTPNEVKLVLTNNFWQRLDAHSIPDWTSYATSRLNLPVSDIKYSAPSGSAKTSFHTLSFKISNNTPYNYTRVPLDILLFSGNSPVGVNSYNVDNFMSAESRTVNISWPAGSERASRVEITPDLNILDSQVYLPYTGTISTGTH